MTIDPATLLWERRVSGGAYLRSLAVVECAPPNLQDALVERFDRISGPERVFYPDGTGRVLDTWNDATNDIGIIGQELRKARVATAYDDDAIEAAAARAAHHCMMVPLAGARAYAEALRVPLPAGPRVTDKGLRRRLVSVAWWRRRLRRIMTRTAEQLFRRLGFVRRQSSAYVSADALERMRQATFKSRHWMAETIAVCQETGEALQLADIAQHSLANPALRRGELMTRARGFQECAEARGDRCIMATLTCPSAFHAWTQAGDPNPRFNGATPRDAQAWLNQRWARARAMLKRRGVSVYGFRCAEPHHDATPHWHMVLYVCPRDCWRVRLILRKVWLQDFRDEPGAARHRVRFTIENPAKGTGVGYIAKYVAKNVDGHGGIGAEASDESGRPVSDDAQHAIAWARLWGVRQFQQVGGPAVTAWRELRRVREPCEDCPPLEAIRRTTDHTDEGGPSWAGFIGTLGGIDASLKTSRNLLDHAEPRCLDAAGRNVLRVTQWGELPAPIVVGLQMEWHGRIKRLPTRIHVWFLVFAPRSGPLICLGPVALTVRGYGAPSGWTNPNETSTAGPTARSKPTWPALTSTSS